MRKKYLSALLFGALLFASAGTFTSCKDYDDDINNLSQRVDQIASDLADLETKVNALGCVESIEFSDGKLIVHTPNGDVSAAMPECTGIKEVKLEGNTLYVDGVEAGKVELGSGEEGQIPVITVKDGKLYVNDQLMDIEVGSNVVLVDNGDTCTITVDGQSVTLMKNAAQLTSIVIENLDEAEFKGTEGVDIQWGVAGVATPDWAGEKGAVVLDQFLVGQISTVNVQVTPADYDLGAQKLTLVDARGNEAPVVVTAEPNNTLMNKTRAASANGSWTLSIAMDETINKTNIEKAFDYDPESTDDIQMAYTLCVNGKPYTTYDLAVVTSSNQYTSGRIANITAARVYFVDEAGREKRASEDKIPAGTTTALTLKNPGLYDYYYTFEGTNKSLAEQYGITISEDGKSIIVPEGAEGVTITLTAHTMSVDGYVCPNAQETIGQYFNQVEINIAGSEIAAEELNVTTHQVKPGDATKEIRVDFTKDGKSIFASFPAANREEARQSGQVVLKEEATQLGFLTNSDANHEFQNVQYFKKDGSRWNVNRDDLLDLNYMTLTVNNWIANDAKPGNYTLSFVVTDDNATVSGNELIKVTVPIDITKPAFGDVFEKDENWANDVYEARIYIKGNNAYLRYIDAYKVKSEYQTKADASKLYISFNALDEFGNYPILFYGGAQEVVTDNRTVMLTPISSDIVLNEQEVYNDDKDGLEVSLLEDMYAYYNVFDGVSVSTETKKAFAITSESFKTQVKTALDGVTAAVYQNGSVLSNVTVGADGAIAIGTLKDNKPNNGFFFELNSDELAVSRLNFANTQDSDANDKLDIFTLYNNTRPISNNQVQVKFEGTNGESASWDTTTNNLIFKPAAESSTLRITFEDATGMKYVRDIKVQKVQ